MTVFESVEWWCRIVAESVVNSFGPQRPAEADWAWQLNARCRTSDPDLFFHSEHERASGRRRRQQNAKQICADCPVLNECRRQPFAAVKASAWGGMSEDERNAALYAAGTTPLGGARNPDRRKKKVVSRL
jgi:WhiB family redox-sensing transcriptional regulator